jgi:E3 ubiquitin-protein ligase HERC4
VVQNLLPSLVVSPPDIEVLRLYLILPLYHEFDNPKNYLILHNPFGHTLLHLKPEASKIIGEHFEICSELCTLFLTIYFISA